MPPKTCALVERLQTIADPRRQCENLRHPLVDVIMLGFCGVLAGCEDFVEIVAWAKEQEQVLGTFLELPHGIPSHDTFNRVFAMLQPEPLQAVLLPWLAERRGLPGEGVHLDGKTLRGTRCRSQQLKALHVVSAWAGQTGLTLGQVAVESKANEITVLPQLLELLDLQDKTVTIDAIGCQKEIAQTIVDGGGNYVLCGQRQSAEVAHRTPVRLCPGARPEAAVLAVYDHVRERPWPVRTAHGAGLACAGVSVRRAERAVGGRAQPSNGHPRGVGAGDGAAEHGGALLSQ